LENQKRFFAQYINAQPCWKYAGMYVDEGISGTGTKKRAGFNQMMDDAGKDLFDLIIIKEISRFARNTVDSLTNIRRLKSLGIGIEFISGSKMNTLKVDEFTITIFSSLAQKESENTSERVKWGQRRRMEQGIAFGCNVLGYNKTKGVLTVNEEEAEIIRMIFRKYCDEGKGVHVISKELEEIGAKTKKGNTNWTNGSVSRILKNEKYAGDLVQRKTYTVDCLTHEKRFNKGEEEFVIRQDNHEPIIDRETFDKAQAELARRGAASLDNARYTIRYPFSGKVKCGCCGKTFVSRKRYERKTLLAWKCYNGYKYGTAKQNAAGETVGCNAASIRDELLQQVFLKSLKDIVTGKEQIIAEVENAVINAVGEIQTSTEETNINREIIRLERKLDVLLDARLENEITKDEFKKKKTLMEMELNILNKKLKESENRQQLIDNQHALMDKIRDIIKKLVSSEEFSGEVCKEVLEKIIVHGRSEYSVYFKDLKDSYFFTELGDISSRKNRFAE